MGMMWEAFKESTKGQTCLFFPLGMAVVKESCSFLTRYDQHLDNPWVHQNLLEAALAVSTTMRYHAGEFPCPSGSYAIAPRTPTHIIGQWHGGVDVNGCDVWAQLVPLVPHLCYLFGCQTAQDVVSNLFKPGKLIANSLWAPTPHCTCCSSMFVVDRSFIIVLSDSEAHSERATDFDPAPWRCGRNERRTSDDKYHRKRSDWSIISGEWLYVSNCNWPMYIGKLCRPLKTKEEVNSEGRTTEQPRLIWVHRWRADIVQYVSQISNTFSPSSWPSFPHPPPRSLPPWLSLTEKEQRSSRLKASAVAETMYRTLIVSVISLPSE